MEGATYKASQPKAASNQVQGQARRPPTRGEDGGTSSGPPPSGQELSAVTHERLARKRGSLI